jgi:hypothetical protein
MGGSAIDFTNLDNGDYRVTITSAGQVSFQYSDGRESATQAGTLQVTANAAAPLGYTTTSTEYIATATVTLNNPLPGEVSTYTSQFRFISSTLPTLFFGNLAFDSSVAPPGSKQLAFQSDSVNLEGRSVNGSTFDFGGFSRGTLNVDPTSLIAAVPDHGVGSNSSPPPFLGSQFSDFVNGDFTAFDSPEPATFILLGGALLAGLAFARLRTRRAC